MNQYAKNLRHILIFLEAPFGLQIIPLTDNYYSLGRHPKNSIVLSDPKISRHHATLVKKKHEQLKEDYYWIYDGNLKGKRSSNGLIVNQKYCLSRLLKNNDLICLGNKVKLMYQDLLDPQTDLLLNENQNLLKLVQELEKSQELIKTSKQENYKQTIVST